MIAGKKRGVEDQGQGLKYSFLFTTHLFSLFGIFFFFFFGFVHLTKPPKNVSSTAYISSEALINVCIIRLFPSFYFQVEYVLFEMNFFQTVIVGSCFLIHFLSDLFCHWCVQINFCVLVFVCRSFAFNVLIF